MSDIVIKKEVRRYIRSSGMEVSSKMICPILKLFKMKHGEVDQKHVAMIATKLINEH